ncbi:uncharacterized protein LOC130589852 [Beta vulgaris subsp. vulgaris]|uniref:uncharacterized protein LOC130589852 n=1 Tax=Beta vulgaris subsp. vulgaris TaxID=3555 RepID=UPI00254720AE|nr:uncharacterized protein LOC130589852 [Beta vulgaris subsp. vulgaris]
MNQLSDTPNDVSDLKWLAYGSKTQVLSYEGCSDGDEIMRDASDEPQITDAAVTKKKSRPRGPTKGIRSKPGIQRVLAWDEWIRPIGRYAGEYKIYCGEISRSKVSILYDTWDDVPEGTQNTLWEDAKREFGIEEDVLKKRDVLTTCDKRWRDFKSRLVTRWITKTRKGLTMIGDHT